MIFHCCRPDGRVDFRMGVPPYPLMWMINGLSLSRNIGLGIMQRPVAVSMLVIFSKARHFLLYILYSWCRDYFKEYGGLIRYSCFIFQHNS